MDWLPTIGDFRQGLRASLEAPPHLRIRQLAALAGHRLGILEVQQLDRAIGRLGRDAVSGFTRLRVGVIGSATLNHLAPCIRVAGLRYDCLFDVHVGGFGQFRHEALDTASGLHQFGPSIVLLSVTVHDLVGDLPLSANESEVEAVLARAIDDLKSVWRSIRMSLRASVIQQTFLDLNPSLFGNLDRGVPGSPAFFVPRLNQRVTAAAAEQGVALLDIAGKAQRDGINAWFDVRYWLQAKQEISHEAAPMYGELFVRIVAAQYGRSRKCLVLDLDNTLWGGVVGDDGIEGIVLGSGSAEGEAYVAFQRYAKHLNERGIILAVCSKNEEATVEAVFLQHPEMVLSRSDIAAFVVNWSDKVKNLQQIATMLNIGVDGLVFVDDNPAERARVREALPMVAVPEMPKDPAHYVGTLAAAGYFEAVGFTSEDRGRAAFYAKDAERSDLLKESRSLDDFLSGLDMCVAHSPFTKHDLARVTQLINKTNQFNTTTRRYTADEIAGIAAAPEYVTLQFRLSDRLGDNGIVSAMILAPDPEHPTSFELLNWVMSCRVFGRELEYEAMNIAVEAATRCNARFVFADYVATERNGMIKDLYAKLGFDPLGTVGESNRTTRWRLDLADYAPRQTKISRKVLQ